jgi:uncharacterized protein
MNTAKVLLENNEHTSKHYAVKKNEIEIKVLVQNASKCIAPVWPLETFIACNPLQGFEGIHFEKALMQALSKKDHSEVHAELEEVNAQMIKWCSAFFDAGQGSIDLPYREEGFYSGFLKLSYFDKTLHHHKKESKMFLKQLPKLPEEAIKLCLMKLSVPAGKEERFLSETLLHLPGWAGFVKWQSDWKNSKVKEHAVSMTEFLAVRLVITYLLWPQVVQSKAEVTDKALAIETLKKLKQSEDNYRKKLLQKIDLEKASQEKSMRRNIAQLIFCIDVRSEPFRRSLESLGDYETFGFAGFFGLPVRFNEFKTHQKKACCPVLLSPRFEAREVASQKNVRGLLRYDYFQAILDNFKNLYMQLKYNFSTPFALVESLGLWCGFNMTLQSLNPSWTKQSVSTVKNWIAPPPKTKIDYELTQESPIDGISLQDQINYAQTVLRLMGLTSNFAKFVILCGHGSTTENNPYASALDCGACGGNHGAMNAQLLASILNKPEVRRGLEEHGMHIPYDTVFYGALHNTTTDVVDFYNSDDQNPIYPELFNQLKKDLAQARVKTNQERALKLSSAQPTKDIIRRSLDWSETRPEWGLARNAAFIVAPRDLTKNISLDGRCFLHSYRWEQDDDGSLLETILTAPMVVAEWINTQYLFSTIDNLAFGSGSKVTHNVVGKIGVMQGNASDLMHGLPLQSVMANDREAYHEPQRLLTIVYAPRDLVLKIIEKHTILKSLFFNEWVHLVVMDPSEKMFYRLNMTGSWDALQQ